MALQKYKLWKIINKWNNFNLPNVLTDDNAVHVDLMAWNVRYHHNHYCYYQKIHHARMYCHHLMMPHEVDMYMVNHVVAVNAQILALIPPNVHQLIISYFELFDNLLNFKFVDCLVGWLVCTICLFGLK